MFSPLPPITHYMTRGLEYDEIPIDMMGTKFYKVTLTGWQPKSISIEDGDLDHIMNLCSLIAKDFIEKYAETHQLSFQFGLKPGSEAYISVGTLEKPKLEESE